MAARVTGIKYGLAGSIVWDDSTRTRVLEFNNIYQLETDSDDDATKTVFSALADYGVYIGAIWEAGEEIEIGARCISLEPVETAPRAWEAPARWSTRRTPTEEESQEPLPVEPTNPVDLTPRHRWYGETIELLQVKDAITGEPLVNAVGEPFRVTRRYRIHVLEIKRYMTAFDADLLVAYVNHTNETEFWGAPPGVALMDDITDDPSEIVFDGQQLREVVFTIKFNFSETDGTSPGAGWKHSFLNEATKYKEYHSGPGETGSPFIFKPFLAMGQPTTGNINLNGEALLEDEPGIYLDFNQFPMAEFNNLKLGPTEWF